MPSFCLYRMCHNLGSSTFLGYCNQYHMEKGLELEKKEAEQKQIEEKTAKVLTEPQDKKSKKEK